MPPRRCSTPNCRRDARKGRRLCHTCETRRKRSRNPMRAAFEALRYNSRRRGKAFSLTWEQFQQFCRKTVYMAGRGRSKESWTIDRERDEEGYTIDNIRVRSKSFNSHKGKKKLVYDWEHPEYAYVINY